MSTWTERMTRGRSNNDRPQTDPETQTAPPAIPPYGEQPYAAVNPYRGMERHGVPSDEAVAQRVAMMDEVPDAYEALPGYTPPHADIEPIPVHIVNRSSDEFTAFRTMQFPVTANVNQLVGRDRMRRKISISNIAGAVCVVGNAPDLTAKTGWPLFVGGAILTMESTEPIYITSADGNNANVAVISEYYVNPMDQNVGWSDDHGPHNPARYRHKHRGE